MITGYSFTPAANSARRLNQNQAQATRFSGKGDETSKEFPIRTHEENGPSQMYRDPSSRTDTFGKPSKRHLDQDADDNFSTRAYAGSVAGKPKRAKKASAMPFSMTDFDRVMETKPIAVIYKPSRQVIDISNAILRYMDFTPNAEFGLKPDTIDHAKSLIASDPALPVKLKNGDAEAKKLVGKDIALAVVLRCYPTSLISPEDKPRYKKFRAEASALFAQIPKAERMDATRCIQQQAKSDYDLALRVKGLPGGYETSHMNHLIQHALVPPTEGDV